MHIYIYIYIFICLRTYVAYVYTNVCMNIDLYICFDAHIYIYLIHTFLHMCIYIYVHVYTYQYIRTILSVYMYTYINTLGCCSIQDRLLWLHTRVTLCNRLTRICTLMYSLSPVQCHFEHSTNQSLIPFSSVLVLRSLKNNPWVCDCRLGLDHITRILNVLMWIYTYICHIRTDYTRISSIYVLVYMAHDQYLFTTVYMYKYTYTVCAWLVEGVEDVYMCRCIVCIQMHMRIVACRYREWNIHVNTHIFIHAPPLTILFKLGSRMPVIACD